MPCYYPITGWKARHVNPSGKRGVVFNKRDGFSDLEVTVACGQCIGCRLERSRQWAMRCVHEGQMHDANSFLTLTLDDAHLHKKFLSGYDEHGKPVYGGSLLKEQHQKFLKRLRRRAGKLSFFLCGEYGEKYFRPHYHAIIFGYGFPDRRYLKTTKSGEQLFRSPFLEEVWPLGQSSVGSLTFESAAYVARYVCKKITGSAAQAHYQRVDLATGEVHSLEPEYVAMSLKPAIGKGWIERYQEDTYPSDTVIMRGMEMRPPRYYDARLELEDPELHKTVKVERIRDAVPFKANNTPSRLRVRHTVKMAQVKFLKREL